MIERRAGHRDEGKVVHETDWKHNLILDQGMDRLATVLVANLFLYCAIGTGNTPTEDVSGATTATTSGTTCTSSGAIFAAGDVGKLLRFTTGEKAKITAYTNSTTVTLASALGVVGATAFTMYRVTQVGLTTETKRSNTYLLGAGNCDYSRSGSAVTNKRTFDFTVEVGSVNYAEVGFSNLAAVAANLNTRALFAGGAVTVLAGQQLRVIYEFITTLSPTTPRTKAFPITGWPSLARAVTADSTTDKITLTSHGMASQAKIRFGGTTAPVPLVLGTDYYVITDTSSTFQVSATPGGAAIDLTTNGTAVTLLTNVDGTEQLYRMGMSKVLTTDGLTYPIETTFSGTADYSSEPMSPGNVDLATDTAAHLTWPQATGSLAITGFIAGGTLVAATYTSGTFTQTYSYTFAVGAGNSAAIRKVSIGSRSGYQTGLQFRFDYAQEKTSSCTLQLVFRKTWDRVFV